MNANQSPFLQENPKIQNAVKMALKEASEHPDISAADRHTVAVVSECADVIIKLAAALRPFAIMHREDSDLEEVACVRGHASDMSIITSGDFKRAFDALNLV